MFSPLFVSNFLNTLSVITVISCRITVTTHFIVGFITSHEKRGLCTGIVFCGFIDSQCCHEI